MYKISLYFSRIREIIETGSQLNPKYFQGWSVLVRDTLGVLWVLLFYVLDSYSRQEGASANEYVYTANTCPNIYRTLHETYPQLHTWTRYS